MPAASCEPPLTDATLVRPARRSQRRQTTSMVRHQQDISFKKHDALPADTIVIGRTMLPMNGENPNDGPIVSMDCYCNDRPGRPRASRAPDDQSWTDNPDSYRYSLCAARLARANTVRHRTRRLFKRSPFKRRLFKHRSSSNRVPGRRAAPASPARRRSPDRRDQPASRHAQGSRVLECMPSTDLWCCRDRHSTLAPRTPGTRKGLRWSRGFSPPIGRCSHSSRPG